MRRRRRRMRRRRRRKRRRREEEQGGREGERYREGGEHTCLLYIYRQLWIIWIGHNTNHKH